MTAGAYAIPRRKGRPGELPMAFGALLILLAPLLIMVTVETDERVAAISEAGIVSQAVVQRKYSEERVSTGRKGRERSTTSYLADVRFDALSTNRYSDWAAGRPYTTSRYPADSNATIELSKARWETIEEGGPTMIAMHPGDLSSIDLAAEVAQQAEGTQSLLQMLAAALSVAGGVAMLILGWRRRRA